jgi:SAM-dependent methyltransferase
VRTALTTLRRRAGIRLPGHIGPYVRCGPLSESWGWDRGKAIDRWYIERFLEAHRDDIRGRVLEVKDDEYTQMFGSGVEQSDILDLNPENVRATFVADLAAADAVPSGTFDCFVLTQVIQMTYDFRAAVGHAARMLKPGGVLLLTAPALNRIDPESDYWRFTKDGVERLVADVFGDDRAEVRAHGNCLVTAAFLTGLSSEELRQRDLERDDGRFPLVITARAVRRTD